MKYDDYFMGLAVAESIKTPPVQTAYSVGAVIVSQSGEVFTGYTHETGEHNHAEEEALLKAEAVNAELKGATIYSSMEPCTNRKSKERSCTELIIEKKIGRVVYALGEPLHFTVCNGKYMLEHAGIEVSVMEQYAQQVKNINKHILK